VTIAREGVWPSPCIDDWGLARAVLPEKLLASGVCVCVCVCVCVLIVCGVCVCVCLCVFVFVFVFVCVCKRGVPETAVCISPSLSA